MTPEQLQEIPGIDPEMVENIRDSVTAYYSQFEEAAPAAENAEEVSAATELETADDEAVALAVESDPAPSTQDPAPSSEIPGESDTIIDSGRDSHDESEGSGSQNV
jgi:hypothetical protein